MVAETAKKRNEKPDPSRRVLEPRCQIEPELVLRDSGVEATLKLRPYCVSFRTCSVRVQRSEFCVREGGSTRQLSGQSLNEYAQASGWNRGLGCPSPMSICGRMLGRLEPWLGGK